MTLFGEYQYDRSKNTNAFLGLARLHTASPGLGQLDAMLARIQNDLFDLGADLCMPERGAQRASEPLRIAPVQVERLEHEIDELNAEHGDKLTFLKMNVDENPVTPSSYRVTGIPTINVYQGGEVVKTIVGARPKAAILKELDEFIN